MQKTITPGQVAYRRWCETMSETPHWEDELASMRDHWEKFAEGIFQPLTVEVPPTDGELWHQAWEQAGESSDDADIETVLEIFLRLVRERDGEPLPVTGCQVCAWWHSRCVNADDGWEELAGIINAHRGVRELDTMSGKWVLPENPVTRDMMIFTDSRSSDWASHADELNAELVKLAGKDGAS